MRMQYNEEDVVDEEDEDAEEGVQWPQDRHNEYQDWFSEEGSIW